MGESLYKFGARPLPEGAIQAWISSRERAFCEAFRRFGELRGSGLEVVSQNQTGTFELTFTGYNLCDYAIAPAFVAIKQLFGPDAAVKAVRAWVTPKDYRPLGQLRTGRFRHYWLRVLEEDRERFLDPTYGQVKKVQNYIRIGNRADERRSYGYVRTPRDVTDDIALFYHDKLRAFEKLSVRNPEYKDFHQAYQKLLAVLTV